jgi:hypothetical protein
VSNETSTPKWRLTWGEHSWTEDDITTSQFALASLVIADGWNSANALASPNHAANLLAILVSGATGDPLDEVLADIGGRPAGELVAALSPA